MTPDGPLTPEQILAAAEDALRRFGPAKATVVDVARALGVSHGSVYRHFPSKSALRGAVTAEWLARIAGPLDVVADTETPAPERLHTWLRALIDAKRSRAAEDPELFETYMILVEESSAAVQEHVEHLAASLTKIVADRHFELVFDATLGDPQVRGFLLDANPAAARAIARRFDMALQRGFWENRRNSTRAILTDLLEDGA